MSKKIIINNIKDFYYDLENILEEYYEKTIDSVQALNKISDLKNAAKDANIQVNIGDNILDNIKPSSSYSSSYC